MIYVRERPENVRILGGIDPMALVVDKMIGKVIGLEIEAEIGTEEIMIEIVMETITEIQEIGIADEYNHVLSVI